ncbi:Carbohydrate-binding X8 domain superfamily protein [Euphorbia peplus]|nr:Carbohydrate-binding X8 domain superfamily protein [Euphorbia peplus]
MHSSKVFLLLVLVLISVSAHSEARKSFWSLKKTSTIRQHIKKMKVTKHFDLASLLLQRETMTPSNSNPYVSSPFSLPPYDSLPPTPLPQNAPPFCDYPPTTPQPPSTIIPTPIQSTPPSPFSDTPPFLPLPNPPPPSSGGALTPPDIIPYPNPPEIVPSPPETVPSPTSYIPSPPYNEPSPPSYIPSPPYIEPSPPSYIPSPSISIPPPTGFVPSPTIFLPPIVFPPPTFPPPPSTAGPQALWCVAKPAVPGPIIQEAMNYACGSGADCDSIQPSGSCFEPNTLLAHASFAFNSYWQRTKVAGGTCSFGGTAMLVTVDPSYDGCHFVYF